MEILQLIRKKTPKLLSQDFSKCLQISPNVPKIEFMDYVANPNEAFWDVKCDRSDLFVVCTKGKTSDEL